MIKTSKHQIKKNDFKKLPQSTISTNATCFGHTDFKLQPTTKFREKKGLDHLSK